MHEPHRGAWTDGQWHAQRRCKDMLGSSRGRMLGLCEICRSTLYEDDPHLALVPEHEGCRSFGSHAAHALCAQTAQGLGSLHAARKLFAPLADAKLAPETTPPPPPKSIRLKLPRGMARHYAGPLLLPFEGTPSVGA